MARGPQAGVMVGEAVGPREAAGGSSNRDGPDGSWPGGHCTPGGLLCT